MYSPVSPSLHSQLYKLCAAGGISVDASMRFTQSKQGRIHDVYFVQLKDSKYVLQCLNPNVVPDSSALANLINNVLAPASLSTKLLTWPTSRNCVLVNETGHWIRRSFIHGEAMTAQLSYPCFVAMAGALENFHCSLSVADFNIAEFSGINPWAGDAARSLKQHLERSSEMTLNERVTVDEWVKYEHLYSEPKIDSTATQVVVHRDTKPSNFIKKYDGSLMLIDFDTIGVGDPVLDLGELIRGWLTSDELDSAASAQQTHGFRKSGILSQQSQYLPVSIDGCLKAMQALIKGYDDPSMTLSRVQRSAIQCCMWQCERFLEDHFSGDLYYPVDTRGDNLIRARQQLDALRLLHGMKNV